MEYILKTQKENDEVSKIIKGWGSDILVSRGKAHKAEELDGILAIDNGKIVGLGLYSIEKDCEITLLETFIQNKGIGTQIIGRKKLPRKAIAKFWLVTTN